MVPLDSKYIILRVYAMPMLKPIGPPYIDKIPMAKSAKSFAYIFELVPPFIPYSIASTAEIKTPPHPSTFPAILLALMNLLVPLPNAFSLNIAY